LLVLDANILIRAVLGTRVRSLLVRYGGTFPFFAPESAFQEAREHLPAILSKRRIPIVEGLQVLDSLANIVQPVDSEAYSVFELTPRPRLARRDVDDWPVLATALALRSPIWTEDTDFFGAGVATWTTDRVEMYLQTAPES